MPTEKGLDEVLGMLGSVKMENIPSRPFIPPEDREKEALKEKLKSYQTILPILKRVEEKSEFLTDWEFEFVHSLKLSILKKWLISEKQIEKLREVAADLAKRN